MVRESATSLWCVAILSENKETGDQRLDQVFVGAGSESMAESAGISAALRRFWDHRVTKVSCAEIPLHKGE